MEGKAALDLHHGSELREPSQQLQVRWVPHLLVTGAGEEAACACGVQQLAGLALALDERLLDVDVGARVEGCAGRLEMSASDVYGMAPASAASSRAAVSCVSQTATTT